MAWQQLSGLLVVHHGPLAAEAASVSEARSGLETIATSSSQLKEAVDAWAQQAQGELVDAAALDNLFQQLLQLQQIVHKHNEQVIVHGSTISKVLSSLSQKLEELAS